MAIHIGAVPEAVALPGGFSAGAVACGLKGAGSLDLGLLLAPEPVAVAAIFTRNELLGAHIPVCHDHLERSGGRARAILVNSRNANCATGSRGIDDARRCCRELAQRLGCAEELVLMASTGPIGAPLPTDRIIAHLDPLLACTHAGGGMQFAHAIMTTDTYAKAAVAKAGAPSTTGFAKGSGMIHPDMATMLGFLLAEAAPTSQLPEMLKEIADRTFHRVTVDGDTSPNDSLFLIAATDDPASRPEATAALLEVATNLSRQLAADGEGASRLVTVQVHGAPSEADAARVGRVIATSPLVKTAIAGRDPNWGRILSAAGRSGVPFSTAAARVWVGTTEVFTHGVPHPEREAEAARHLTGSEQVVVGIDLDAGQARADVWTCDLTADYIRINADYRT